MANPITAEVRRILREQGQQFAGSDDDLTLALGQMGRPELAEIPEFRADYDAIREANAAGTVEGIANTAKSAFDRSVQAKNVIGTPDETDAQDIADRELAIRGRTPSFAWQKWQESTGADAVKTFLSDPVEITANIVASGLAGSLPAIGGGLAGGAIGAAGGGPAAPVTGAIGAAVGTGAGSLAVEYGNKYLDTLRDAGADLADPASILRVVNDPEVRARAQELGLRRGLPVAVFDAASAGLAGKFLKGVSGATLGQNVRHGLAEAAIQGGLGGAGEVAGALSAGEDISPGAVFEEVVGELGPGATEVAGAALRRRMAGEPTAALTPNVIARPAPSTAQATPSIAPAPAPAEATNVAVPATTAPVPGSLEWFTGMAADEGLNSTGLPDRTIPPAELSPADYLASAGDRPGSLIDRYRNDLMRRESARRSQIENGIEFDESSRDEIEKNSRFNADNRASRNAPDAHRLQVKLAVDGRNPVNAEAVQTYGIQLPEGYVQRGDRYVFEVPETSTLYEYTPKTAQQYDYNFTTAEGASASVRAGSIDEARAKAPPGARISGDPVPVETPYAPPAAAATPVAESPIATSPVALSETAPAFVEPAVSAPLSPSTPVSPLEVQTGEALPGAAGIPSLLLEPVAPAATPAISEAVAAPAVAPATYLGAQDTGEGSSIELWNLTADIPGHPVGSTVSRQTLEQAGFQVPPAPVAAAPTTAPTALNTEPAPDVPAAPEPSPTLEQRLREELNKPEPIAFGPIAAVDVRVPASLDDVAPPALEQGLAKTREAAILLAPDGTVVLAGLTPKRRLASVAGGTQYGAGVQNMGAKADGQHTVHESGPGPALLADVVAAGYRYLGKVQFDPEAEPGRIFQRWANKEVFDASIAAARGEAPTSPALRSLSTQADALLAEQPDADPARALEIDEQLGELRDQYRAAGGEPQFGTEAAPAPQGQPQQITLPAEANRTQQLQRVVARMQQWGADVNLFGQEIFRANLEAELNSRLETLIARYQTADEATQPALQRKIEALQQKLGSLEQVRGVMFSPSHIAIALDDVQNANVASLTWLLHEASHAILGRDPAMQRAVLKAVEATISDLRQKLTEEQAKSGVREANLGDPEELIVSLLAQKLANEGIPDAPTLAQAAWQWVKDLYFRLAMSVQAAFGVQPNPQLALDWFENQVRRVVGGDYDYRLNNLFTKLAPETPAQQVTRFGTRETTPGGISDYFDPLTDTTRQPEVAPESAEAVGWNLRFGTEDSAGNPGQELDIPFTEAKARIMAAATNEAKALAQTMYAVATEGRGEQALTFDQWWAMVGRGDTPDARLAAIEQGVPGAGGARIGDDRMTDAMNQRARLEAKVMLHSWLNTVTNRDATAAEQIDRAEKQLTDQAKSINKIEGDLRNAEMHEATLGDKLKEMVKELARGIRRGLDTAQRAGALAQAVRDAEGLAENEPIPAEYQRVFKEVMADGVRIFDYLRGIANLDLNLGEMTQREIIQAINANAASDSALARLVEPRNRPLLVALVALAKHNAPQIDLIQLRQADAERYLKIKGELDAIRQATPDQLAAMERTAREGKTAATMADRIKRAYVAQRTKLRKAQQTIQQAEERRGVLAGAREGILAKVDEMETNGMPAPSEWRPRHGETYLAMRQGEDGTWTSAKRDLAFTDEGGSVDPDQMLTDLAGNREYLRDNKDRAGSKTYQLVEQQTRQLEMLDARARVPEIKRAFFEKWLLPSSEMLASGGGAGAARANQMLKRFQFILFSNWQNELEAPAIKWQTQLRRAAEAAGVKDVNAFVENVYEPAVYRLNSEPGLDEGPALRTAVKAARERLNTEPNDKFDDAFKELLRQTKTLNDRFLKIAEDNGTFVADPRLGGELRRAVDRGWLTLMRRMNAGTVSTVLRDMEEAGWKIEFKDQDGKPLTETLDEGVARGHRVAGSSTFDALRGEEGAAVLEDPALFAQAISGFFPPGVVDRWLKPFINKPGEPLFSHRGEDISQLDVQQAWAESGGDVGKWIEALGAKVDLERDALMDEDGAEVQLGDMSLEAEWRASMLRQLEGLFTMESRIAADANQTKGLFDATGRPPHTIMDARENELLPAEHVQHMTFDLVNTKNLLATLAFHGAFGRNGEAMTAAINEIEGRLLPRVQAFNKLPGGTKKARKAAAEARGWNYDELARAAAIYPTVMQGKDALRAQFGFGGATSVLGDVRGALELLHFIAGQTTNNPKTGLLNMLQLTQRAIARRSLGATVWRDTASAGGEITRQFFGQILQAFGLNLVRAAHHAKEIGAAQGQGLGALPWTEVAGIAMGRRGEELPVAIKTMRTAAALQKRARLGVGEVGDFPALQAVPFLNNTMQGMSLAAAISNGTAEANAVESLVGAAAKYFEAHPEALNDPTFQLTAKDVGLYDKAWFADETSFRHFRRKLVEYGIGNLETLARTALENQSRGEPIIGKDAVLKAAMMSGNELDLQGSINTNPAAFDTNPVLKFASPLLGWPLRQMNQVHAAMRGEDGRVSVRSMAQTLGILAAWSLPIGLAFTFLSDQYDDKLLKKKSNLGSISGDNSAKDNVVAVLQRLSRAGNIYGLGADFAATTLAGLDPTSGQRAFSLDSRILAFSQLRTIQDALSAYVNSGFNPTFASVERPLLQAMGGNGALHALDLMNAALGIDNQEARITRRTNAQQWLRAAGKEAGIEVRRSGGASSAPTELGTWTREMSLAAMGNDRLGFLDAYRRAVDVARKEGEPNPEQRVLESWRSRDPRKVFAEKPTELQMQRAMNAMSDNGKEAVRDALRLFDHYTDLIAPTKEQQRERQQLGQATRAMTPPTMESMRRQMASSVLSVR